jgi:hypothetical protein
MKKAELIATLYICARCLNVLRTRYHYNVLDDNFLNKQIYHLKERTSIAMHGNHRAILIWLELKEIH